MVRMRIDTSGTTTKPAGVTRSSDIFKPNPLPSGPAPTHPQFSQPGTGAYVRAPSYNPAPAPAAPPAPIAPRRVTPNTQIGSGATGTYSGSSAAFADPGLSGVGGGPIAPISEDEYIANDSIHTVESAGINAELQNLLAQLKQQRGTYDADFGESMDQLGWEGDPLGEGSWDRNDRMGAYGAAFGNQTNDFAGRGMLTSSFYGDAVGELDRRFNDQRGSLISGRQRQMDDWGMQEAQGNARAQQALDQARASAIARRAAQFGLI